MVKKRLASIVDQEALEIPLRKYEGVPWHQQAPCRFQSSQAVGPPGGVARRSDDTFQNGRSVIIIGIVDVALKIMHPYRRQQPLCHVSTGEENGGVWVHGGGLDQEKQVLEIAAYKSREGRSICSITWEPLLISYKPSKMKPPARLSTRTESNSETRS